MNPLAEKTPSPPTSHQTPEVGYDKNLAIEKLRAVAIIFVLLWHSRDITLDPWHLQHSYYALWTGVDLFFAISGYVITRSLLQSNRSLSLRDYLSSFYIKRLFRITPSAFVCIAFALLLTLAAVPLFGVELFRDTVRDARPALLSYADIAYYFKDSNRGGTMLGIFWSLSLEEQFYLVVPLLIWFWRRHGPTLLLLLFGAALVQAVWVRDPWQTLLWSMRTDALIYGVIIAVTQYALPDLFTNAERAVARIPAVMLWIANGALIVALATIASDHMHSRTGRATSWAGVISALLVALAVLTERRSRSTSKLALPLLWVGSRSYSLYLYHNIALIIVKGVNVKWLHVSLAQPSWYYVLYLGLALALPAALAEINYQIIEIPLRNVGRRIVSKRNLNSPSAAPTGR